MTSIEKVNAIISDHFGIISKICRQYYQKNPKHLLDLEDYYQEAYLIIMDVADKYDSRKGKLNTYLYQSLKNGLSRLANQNNSMLSVTDESVTLATKIFTLQQCGNTNGNICNILNISYDRLLECQNILNRYPLVERITDKKDNWRNIFTTINQIISDEERLIINAYLSGRSTKEIAILIKKPPSATREYMRKILTKIKNRLAHNE